MGQDRKPFIYYNIICMNRGRTLVHCISDKNKLCSDLGWTLYMAYYMSFIGELQNVRK